MKKRILSYILALAIGIGLMPVMTIPAFATSTISIDSKDIYANGNAIILKAGTLANYTNIYIDNNRDGILDDGEVLINLNETGLFNGKLAGNTTQGFDLSSYFIYGGSRYAETGDTKITMLSGTVDMIHGGGNKDANVVGNTDITLSGGKIRLVRGGGLNSSVSGSTNVLINGANITQIIYGGGFGSNTTVGTTNITIKENSQINADVYGGGQDGNTVLTSTNVIVDGGDLNSGRIFGGGSRSNVGTTTSSAICNVTINGNIDMGNRSISGASSDSTSVVYGSTNVVINNGILEYVAGGGYNSRVTENTAVTVNGGRVTELYGGDFRNGTVDGNASIYINSGSVSFLYLGADPFYNGNVTGNANATIAGGNIYSRFRIGKVTGTSSAKITGGNILPEVDSAITYVTNGSVPVYKTAITIGSVGDKTITSLGITNEGSSYTYGLSGVYTSSSKLYAFLPEGAITTEAVVEDRIYQNDTGIVTDKSGTASGTLILPVSFTNLTANGESNTTTTTQLTLTFDTDPTPLAVGNITVTGAKKDTLSGTGTTRTLSISNITVADGDNVTVDISNPAGLNITPTSKTVAVYKQYAPTLTDITLTPAYVAYADKALAGTKVADLAASGTPTTGITYSLDGSGTHDGLFQISGTQLQIKSGTTLAAQSYTVKVKVTEEAQPLNTYTKLITFTANVEQAYAISTTTNAVTKNGITATATVGASQYTAGATATVTITLSGTAAAAGTHTVGLTSSEDAGTITAPTTVTKTVAAGETPTDTFAFTFTMPAKEVDDLVVTHDFVPVQTYSMTASALTTFASQIVGYATAPLMQTVTITNTGNQVITLLEPATTNPTSNYNIGTLSTTTLTVGGSATFTVQPKTSLAVGTYTETINIVGSNSAATSVSAQFSVTSANNSDSGSYTPPSQTPTPTTDDKVEVIFGKDTEKAGTINVEEKNNVKTTTITLDDAAVKANLDKLDKADINGIDNKVIISVNNNSDVVAGELNGQTVKNMEGKSAILEIRMENAIYTLPASEINIDKVLNQMGKEVGLKDIKVSVSIAEASSETGTIVADSEEKNSYSVVVKPVEFEITCTSGNKTVNVSKFNSYVERTIAIPDGIDTSKITTGVVVNSDGTFSHVPTSIVVIDGKYFAKINSLTNSTYTVIYNPISFKDVEKHWSKDYVNDIGSRLIDSGVGSGNFAPNKAITRAEFASMIVKALGLKGTDFSGKFSDVTESDPNYSAIYTAYEYGILEGYPDGKFGPQDLITRQQAMTMILKAMTIAGMDGSIPDSEISSQLNLFRDSGDISSYAKQGAAICIKYGIFEGNKGKLNPTSNLTRAESATIILKLLKKSSLI